MKKSTTIDIETIYLLQAIQKQHFLRLVKKANELVELFQRNHSSILWFRLQPTQTI
jgi:hypothetical protein